VTTFSTTRQGGQETDPVPDACRRAEEDKIAVFKKAQSSWGREEKGKKKRSRNLSPTTSQPNGKVRPPG